MTANKFFLKVLRRLCYHRICDRTSGGSRISEKGGPLFFIAFQQKKGGGLILQKKKKKNNNKETKGVF